MEPGSGTAVSAIMDRKVVAVSKTTTIGAAMKLMKASSAGVLPVMDSGRLVGLVDEELLIENMGASGDVRAIMRPPIFVEAGDMPSDAIKRALESQLTRIPVVDSKENMRLVGIVSTTELLEAAKRAK